MEHIGYESPHAAHAARGPMEHAAQRERWNERVTGVSLAALALLAVGLVALSSAAAHWPELEAWAQPLQAALALLIVALATLARMRVRRHFRRLESLAVTAERIAAGESGLRASEGPPGELGHLARAFNQMTDRLVASANAVAEAHERLAVQARELEREVRASDARLRGLMQQAQDLVFLITEFGEIVELNPAAERALGLTWQQLLGQPFGALLPRRELERFARVLEGAREGRGARLDGQRLVRSDGGAVEVDFTTSAGTVEGHLVVLLIGRDVTERKRLEQQTLQNDRMAAVGALAAGVAHEINNPMAYVSSNLQLMQRSVARLIETAGALPGAADVARGVSLLEDLVADSLEGCDRVQAIVRDMKAFSHTAGAELEPVDLSACAEGVLRMAQHELKFRARVERDFAERLPPVLANAGKVRQVLLNLVINAAHALPMGHVDAHRVRLRTWRDGERVAVSVQDTGCGIPREHLARIWDPFFTTKAVGEGTGLGLAISLDIVRKLGGTIDVETEPGRGTTFTVWLPVATQEQQRALVESWALRAG